MSQVGYYDQEFEPWARGIRSIGSMIAQGPALRAAAEQRRSGAALDQARIATEGTQQEHYRAGTENIQAKTRGEVSKQAAVEKFSKGFGNLTTAVQKHRLALQAKAPPETLAQTQAEVDAANAATVEAAAQAGEMKVSEFVPHIAKMFGLGDMVAAGMSGNENQGRTASALMSGGDLPAATEALTVEQADKVNESRGPRESTKMGDVLKQRSLYSELSAVKKAIRDLGTVSTESGLQDKTRLVKEAKAIQSQIDAMESGGSAAPTPAPPAASKPLDKATGGDDWVQPQDPDDSDASGRAVDPQSRMDSLIREAQLAIQQGADPAAVMKRAKEKYGVTLTIK